MEISSKDKYFDLIKSLLNDFENNKISYKDFMIYIETRELEYEKAIQNTMKELKKKRYIDVEREIVVKWSDIEKAFGKVE